jgi:hypothetical protein
MQALVRQWEQESDAKAVFLTCYRMMTSNTLAAIERQEFQDPAWVSRLLQRFADYYFLALEAYEGDPAAAPLVWQLAFNTARDPQAAGPLQNLLLGVNAHINYDLVLTLADLLRPEWSSLSAAQRAARYADHCRVNAVIAGTIDSVQDQILEPGMPVMAIMDQLLGPLDELLVSRLITQWRETVWHNACRLLEAGTAGEQTPMLQQVEAGALRLGTLICPRAAPPSAPGSAPRE